MKVTLRATVIIAAIAGAASAQTPPPSPDQTKAKAAAAAKKPPARPPSTPAGGQAVRKPPVWGTTTGRATTTTTTTTRTTQTFHAGPAWRQGYAVHGAWRPPVRVARYPWPPGARYRWYRRGERLPVWAWTPAWFITDFLVLGLAAPPQNAVWVRYGPDALLVDTQTGEVIDTVYGVYDDGTEVAPPPPDLEAQPAASEAPPQKLIDTFNPDPCAGAVGAATLDADRPLHIDRIELWMTWGEGETSAPYRVLRAGEEIGGGVLMRGRCDPARPNWCAAGDSPGADLEPGAYAIQLDHAALCENSLSNGAAVLRLWGQWR